MVGGNLFSAGGVHGPQSHADLMQFLPDDDKWVDFPKDSRRQTETAEALSPSAPSSAKLEVALAKHQDLFAQSSVLIQHLVLENNQIISAEALQKTRKTQH